MTRQVGGVRRQWAGERIRRWKRERVSELWAGDLEMGAPRGSGRSWVLKEKEAGGADRGEERSRRAGGWRGRGRERGRGRK